MYVHQIGFQQQQNREKMFSVFNLPVHWQTLYINNCIFMYLRCWSECCPLHWWQNVETDLNAKFVSEIASHLPEMLLNPAPSPLSQLPRIPLTPAHFWLFYLAGMGIIDIYSQVKWPRDGLVLLAPTPINSSGDFPIRIDAGTCNSFPQSQPETSPDSDQAALEHRWVHIEFVRFETDFHVALPTIAGVSDARIATKSITYY